nr:OsmC family protein [Thermoanaerobacterium thermosaccharolyticum]
MAIETFKAVSRKLPEGLAVESEVRGFKMLLDEPKEMGGTNKGMNPVEALLCALGSCQTIVEESQCFHTLAFTIGFLAAFTSSSLLTGVL